MSEQIPGEDTISKHIENYLDQDVLKEHFKRKEILEIKNDIEEVLIQEWHNLGTHLENRVALLTELYLRNKLISQIETLRESHSTLRDENINLRSRVQVYDQNISEEKRELLLHISNLGIGEPLRDLLKQRLIWLEKKEQKKLQQRILNV